MHLAAKTTPCGAENAAALEQLRSGLERLFSSFSDRIMNKQFADQTNTCDFTVIKRGLTLSPDLQRAQLELGIGFGDLPLDETALNRFSVGQVASMTEREKKFEMKLVPLHLELLKVTGVWKVISYGELLQTLNGKVALYQRVENKIKVKQ